MDPYKVLKVNPHSSKDVIKKAYRKQALKYHPDRNPGDKKAEEKFKEITFAYDLLMDDARRTKYDQTGDVKDCPEIDNTFNQAMGLLSETMLTAVRGTAIMDKNNPVGINVKEVMESILKDSSKGLQMKLVDLTRAKDTFVAIHKAFVIDLGDNYLQMIAKVHLDKIEIALEATKLEVVVINKAMEILNKHGYLDPNPKPKTKIHGRMVRVSIEDDMLDALNISWFPMDK